MAATPTLSTTSQNTKEGTNRNARATAPAQASAADPNRISQKQQMTEEQTTKVDVSSAAPTNVEALPPATNVAELQTNEPQSPRENVTRSEGGGHVSQSGGQAFTAVSDGSSNPVSNEATQQSRNPTETQSESTLPVSATLTPTVIATYARKAGVDVFQDQHGTVFAWVPVKTGGQKHFECLPVGSRHFLARLLCLFKGRTDLTLSTVKQAIDVLRLDSYGAPKRNLDNRRTTVGADIFIDLADDCWRSVRINSNGWTVESPDQPRFYRPQHMRPLPVPVSGGNLANLFKYVPADDSKERILLMAWLLGGLYDRIPNPILLLVGQQGSAKTTRSRRLRSLLDPSITLVLGDLEMSNLFLTFQHHAVPCFENVSRFNRREADMFCRAVTGNGTERRKLYTDGDQVLYAFRRAIIMNGIDIPSTRPDFLDRCLTINCRRMAEFITLDELDKQFEAARPELFGAMLDLLVKALVVLPTTPAATEFRMADFAQFGRAVAVALGLKPQDFDDAYRMNIQQQGFEILEDAPMGRLLEKFAAKYAEKPWEGTAEELMAKLKEVAHVSGDTDAKSDLPKSARWLSSRLGELAPALVARQVFITKQPRTNAKRLWNISSTIPKNPNAEPDDIFEILEDAGNQEKPVSAL